MLPRCDLFTLSIRSGHPRHIALCLLALACAGCGSGGPARPAAQPVEAKLTLDGAPFGPALVMLVSTQTGGITVGGEADAQGNVTFTTAKRGDGVPVGEYKATVPPDPLNRTPKPIPLVYQKASSSPITVKIEAKKNSIQIGLDSKVKDTSTPGGAFIGGGKTSAGPQRPAIDPKLMPKTGP